MKINFLVASAVLMACALVPMSEAGMNDWFGGMFGGGGGDKGKGKGGRRRPHGGYRPIYINAPPIVQHAPPPPPPLYQKPVVPSYGVGYGTHSFVGGHGLGSYGLGGHSIGSTPVASFKSSHAAPIEIHSKGLGSHSGGGFSSSSFSSLGTFDSGSSFGSVGSFDSGSSFGSLGSYGSTGFSSIPAHVETITHSSGPSLGHSHTTVGFDGNFHHSRGKDGSLITSYGDSTGLIAPPVQEVFSNDIHAHAVHTTSSYGSSYGGGSHKGFGPIKDDDLITVSNDLSGTSAGGVGGVHISDELSVPQGFSHQSVSVPQHDLPAEIKHELPAETDDSHSVEAVNEIDFSTALKTGRQIDHRPPVYQAGSNQLAGEFAGHPLAAKELQENLSFGSGLSSAIAHAHGSAQLPMAEHGTSSISYLEQPPAPLYSLNSVGSSSLSAGVSSIHSGDKSFIPSKQIPFPEEVTHGVEHPVSIDVDTSYSAPNAAVSTGVPSSIVNAHGGIPVQTGSFSESSQAFVTYDSPLNYNDPIIEIVFEDADPTHTPAPIEIDPSLYQPQADDVEVYFIEVSDDKPYESIDDLDLTGALKGVREEFPNGLPSELSQTLINSGYLDNAQIEVLDLNTALGDNSLDFNVRNALREVYGSESKSLPTVVDAPKNKTDEDKVSKTDTRTKRLANHKQSETSKSEVIQEPRQFAAARYGGVVKMNEKESRSFSSAPTDDDKTPIPELPEIKGKKISGVLVYKDSETIPVNSDQSKTLEQRSNAQGLRTARQVEIPENWSDGDWQPVAPYVRTPEKSTSS
ncbi:uncharacterized protein LOC108681575 [Hyalella azteca]|uniref:Uncharacterized protein LOC108681575 n=1 Tax=Hyalella azteca TaxID=294128 RepID=A0A8B7PJE1_HYAAZ|nr:uncharacterized protein LOC108681575 [Hyalella azteca]